MEIWETFSTVYNFLGGVIELLIVIVSVDLKEDLNFGMSYIN